MTGRWAWGSDSPSQDPALSGEGEGDDEYGEEFEEELDDADIERAALTSGNVVGRADDEDFQF